KTVIQPVAPAGGKASVAMLRKDVVVFSKAICGIIHLILTKSRSDLIHIGVAHSRGLHGRYMSFVLLNLGCKRYTGASRSNHGKHKDRFPHERILLNGRAHPAPSFLR